MVKKLDTETFIKRSILRHKNKFCYSEVNYVNSVSKIVLICEMCHEFSVRPDMYLNRGDGCRRCKNINMVHFQNFMYERICDFYKVRNVGNIYINRHQFGCYLAQT